MAESSRGIWTLVTLVLALGALAAEAAPMSVFLAKPLAFTESLNGDWSFKYIPSLDAAADANFFEPSFPIADWKKIAVPSNWELRGFAKPGYKTELADGLGLYRRSFRIPTNWKQGRRVCLRFEGVAFGFTVWVNGKLVGTSSASAFNPNTFDITDDLLPDPQAENMLAVQVSTKPLGYEFDVNDDWSLSGIYRDVSVLSVPSLFVQDLSTSTKLTKDGSVELGISVATNETAGEVSGELLSPDGTLVSRFVIPRKSNGRFEATIAVKNPLLWTAETPALYTLKLSLASKGEVIEKIEETVGLRDVSIVDGVLLLNGRPIKLRGVDHHDMDPLDGRAITETEMRRDLELMQKGNINFIRTSHYPPQPKFLELCDEMGFYVMCEVPIGMGEEHLSDPKYHDNILSRVDATIVRDKNHPSIIVWSIGNENPATEVELEACRRAKELDPTRPVCLPKTPDEFEKSYANFPDYVDIYSPHYPTNAQLHKFAAVLKRPTIFTEYAHALGLATDRIQDQWEIMQSTPNFAGGAIWHFMDQGILRRSEKPVDAAKPTSQVWLDENRYYDTHNDDGTDGLVYSDRTPQPDFWETRKVYSPVQIQERSVSVAAGHQEVLLAVENRYDFRSLSGLKVRWSLKCNGSERANGEQPLKAGAHERETVRIPLDIPAGGGDVLALDLQCVDEKGESIVERTLRLDLEGADRGSWMAALPTNETWEINEQPDAIKIQSSRWLLTVFRATGELTISSADGQRLVEGIYPHTGHKFTTAERYHARKLGSWRTTTLTKVEVPQVQVNREGKLIRLSVSGTYPRQDQVEGKAPKNQSLVGGYELEIAPNGTIDFHYDYAPTNASGVCTEAGLSILLAPGLGEFRWIGQGPYAGYPGKDRLNEFGIFHLNREDLRFQGNRRETELALLTNDAGAGVAMATKAADVSVERKDDKVRLSHNAVIASPGNKGWLPEVIVEAAKTPHISGQFILVLLDANWPAALTRWFGNSSTKSEIFHPFYHSYDQ